MFVGTWWSLMPPIVAIALALLTKEVYLSLFAGCALGALLAAEFHPWIAFDTLFNTMIDSVDFSILMFMILLGMIVMLMQESGGTRAYGEWASSHLKSKRSALVTTSLLGALIFVDDYFNCLTVGSVMRPVTDKYKVSRAKLAYIIDATAAPVCIIAPISSWAAAVNSYVPAGSSMSGFEMFVKTIPFNLYAILTLYMVFFTSIVGFDFGLMKKHEENAAKGDLFTSGGEEFQNQETKDPTEGGKYAKGKVIDLIAPMVVMIATAIAAMIWTGHLNGGQNLVEDFANCSSSEALVFAGGTKEMLEVKAGDFLYAEAKGNYVKVGYRSDSDKEKKITWRLLRATMKQAEEAVSACPFIIRCHRAFLVNIRMVVKVDGNSQGYKLNLEGCEEDVPVSRAYAKEVKALIENRTKS